MRFGPKVSFVLALAVAVLPAMSGTDTQPAEKTEHKQATPPIDCPLHNQGVDTHHLKPFEDVEEYIALLERPDRAAWQRPDAIVAALALSGTEVIADIGAGSGYFSFRFAEALPEGSVRAIDIEPEMLRHIHHKATSSGISNIEIVVAAPDDPHVAGDEDLVFICDVLHHVDGREAWLARLFSQTKTGARLVLVEFKEGDLPLGPPEAMKIPKESLIKLVSNAGFVLTDDRSELLPYQNLLVFSKPSLQPESSVKPGINDNFLDPALDVDKFVERFEGESREIFVARAAIVDALQIQSGQRVADVGAGTGPFIGLFAEAVGSDGKVYAIDIAPRFVEHLAQRARQEGHPQIEARLCGEKSVDLPAASIDLAFICDVYHHFEYPRSTMASIHEALSAGGEVVIIDFEKIPGVSREWVMDHVRAGKAEVVQELDDFGFDLVEEFEFPQLKENWVMRFRKR